MNQQILNVFYTIILIFYWLDEKCVHCTNNYYYYCVTTIATRQRTALRRCSSRFYWGCHAPLRECDNETIPAYLDNFQNFLLSVSGSWSRKFLSRAASFLNGSTRVCNPRVKETLVAILVATITNRSFDDVSFYLQREYTVRTASF